MNFALWVNFCHIMGLIVEILLITCKNECLLEEVSLDRVRASEPCEPCESYKRAMRAIWKPIYTNDETVSFSKRAKRF